MQMKEDQEIWVNPSDETLRLKYGSQAIWTMDVNSLIDYYTQVLVQHRKMRIRSAQWHVTNAIPVLIYRATGLYIPSSLDWRFGTEVVSVLESVLGNPFLVDSMSVYPIPYYKEFSACLEIKRGYLRIYYIPETNVWDKFIRERM